MKHFIDHIELWLSATGVVVILGVPLVFVPSEGAFWKVAAITAIIVGLLHGLIFWTIRRRQRRIRQQLIMELREMLADVVKNQLAVIDLYLPNEEKQALVEEEMGGIKESISAISRHVDTISEESLHAWKRKYPEAVRNATQIEPA